jgi:hypothetical protein
MIDLYLFALAGGELLTVSIECDETKRKLTNNCVQRERHYSFILLAVDLTIIDSTKPQCALFFGLFLGL